MKPDNANQLVTRMSYRPGCVHICDPFHIFRFRSIYIVQSDGEKNVQIYSIIKNDVQQADQGQTGFIPATPSYSKTR